MNSRGKTGKTGNFPWDNPGTMLRLGGHRHPHYEADSVAGAEAVAGHRPRRRDFE
jgi:hypothetical protein